MFLRVTFVILLRILFFYSKSTDRKRNKVIYKPRIPIPGSEFKPLTNKYLPSANYGSFLTLKGLVPWKEKNQENHATWGAENVREKGRSTEKLAQQKKLISQTDLTQYSFSSIKKKNSCSKQLFEMHKLADLHLYTSTKYIDFHQLRKIHVLNSYLKYIN